MTRIHLPLRAVGALVLATLSAAAVGATPQSGCLPETFSALAVNRSDDPVLLSSDVDMQIRRWSTDAEKTALARTLLNDGARALAGALQQAAPVGDIRSPYTFPYDLRFAWQEPLEGDGRRILLIADRAVAIWKDAMGLRDSRDAFTVIELRIPDVGDGEGKVAIGAGVHTNRSLDLIELDDYAASPVRLIGVRTRWAPTTASAEGGRPCPRLPGFSVR